VNRLETAVVVMYVIIVAASLVTAANALYSPDGLVCG
jgi:hypothetical protein